MKDTNDINYYIKNIYDVNLYTAIKYLCALACMTDNCKSFNFKREQLLIIYKLCCIKNNIDIWDYDEIGELILNSKGQFSLKGYGWIDCFYTVKDGDKIVDINKRIEDDLSDTSKIYPIYKLDKYSSFSNESKDLLTEIFREFGGYDPKILADWMEEIVKSYSNNYPTFQITFTLNLFLEDKIITRKLQSNKIFNFINNFVIETRNNNLEFDISKVSSSFKNKFINMSYEEQKELLELLGIIDEKSNFISENNYNKDSKSLKIKKIIKRNK